MVMVVVVDVLDAAYYSIDDDFHQMVIDYLQVTRNN
jgi:hypothetical protein